MAIEKLPDPDFINRDPATIIAETVADYEARVGRVLEPAQIETLVLRTFSYRELLVRNQIQDSAKQNLLAFARFPIIDYLGDFLGVYRLPSQAALTTIELNLVEGHGDIVVPSGLRVQTTDGRVTFEIIQDVPVLTGVNTATVTAIAQQFGKLGNDYAIGTISVILDPQPYLSTAENTTVSEGGSDEETDDQLRERIRLAPNRFSNAGPVEAYKFYAASASPLIIDVAVPAQPEVPGTVRVYPLVEGLEETPTEILDAVFAILNADKIRPLSDTVQVISPTAVDVSIVVDLTLYESAVQSDIVPIIEAKLQAFKDGRRKLLGQDVVISQIQALSVIAGVYDAEVTSPVANVVIEETEFANITSITVNVVGTNEG
jgi:phage-related baseplate assembly protein